MKEVKNIMDGASATTWVSSIDISALATTVESIIPVILPTLVTLSGIRKAISFMFSMIAGA